MPHPILLTVLASTCFVVQGASAQLMDDPVDPNLTPEARSLFRALHELRTLPHIAFGQHLVDWASATQPTGSVVVSDWQAVTGTRPSIHEWDWIVLLNGSAGNYSVNQVAVAKVRAQFTEGAAIGIAWHLPNPALQGQSGNNYNAHGATATVPRLLPGGDLHAAYISNYLSKMADAIDAMQVNGVRVPIIMRPYHEPGWIVYNSQGQATDGFWWNWSTPEEYKALWRMTVEYFRDTRGLNNLLWAYCPNWPGSQAFYDERYQRDWVDICGADQYRSPSDPNPDFATPISFAIARAEADGKIVAFTEMGAQDMAGAGSAGHSFWFGRTYQDLAEVADKVSYAMTWANWGAGQYYLPHAASPAAFKQDFIDFLATDEIMHLGEMQAELGDLYAGEFACSSADFAEPYGTLNFFDVSGFLNAFGQGCQSDPGPVDPAVSQSNLQALGTAWSGTGSVSSNAASGLGVVISGTAGSTAFGLQALQSLNLSAHDSVEFDIQVISGGLNGTKMFFQTGSGWAWNESSFASLTPGSTTRVVLDITGVVNRHDIRGWGFQCWGASSGTPVQIRITPVGQENTGPCSPADLAEPFGTLNFFDVSAFLGAFGQGCD
jgi:mannan endo-1,4-beta-mannosidase